MKTCYFLICLIIMFAGCQNNDAVSPDGGSKFSIYLLKDRTLHISNIINTDINDLVIEDTPWVAAADIEFYDYSSHCIYLKKTKDELFTKQTDIKMGDQPFVVCANNRRCYIGTFHSLALSSLPEKPFIDEIDIQSYAPDILHISKAWDGINKFDLRNNPDVETDLTKSGKLHNGLFLSIGNVVIVSNGDTAVVQYSYSLKNNDKDNLYVPDPDKMGSSLFHYYTNGIVFTATNKMIQSDYKNIDQPEPFNSWKPEWFTKINKGSTMQRTVILKGYPHIPDGSYSYSFNFSSPKNIEKSSRTLSDGRYWIGEIQAELKH